MKKRAFEKLIMGCIYLATNKVTGRQYVGRTKFRLTKRVKRHTAQAHQGKDDLFHRSIRKHGIGNFEWREILTNVPEDRLNELEIVCIALYETKEPNGYNLTDGGEGFLNPSPELRKRYAKGGKNATPEGRASKSEKMKGNKHLLGYSPSEETREKLRKTSTGRVQSKETRDKRSASLKKYNADHPRTVEMNKRVSMKLTGRKIPEDIVEKTASKNRGRGGSELWER